jgi:23S rRNA-/tRNA-specific pseudouridylate synthase
VLHFFCLLYSCSSFFCALRLQSFILQPLLRLLREQFASVGFTAQYFDAAARCGAITVNGERVDAGFVVTAQSRIKHVVLRREPPVGLRLAAGGGAGGTAAGAPAAGAPAAGALAALDLDADDARRYVPFDVTWHHGVGVVNKPAGLPVHPSGMFAANTVTAMLSAAFGGSGSGGGTRASRVAVHAVHRLDRLTSGLLLVCKVSVLLCTVTFYANLADSLTRSP